MLLFPDPTARRIVVCSCRAAFALIASAALSLPVAPALAQDATATVPPEAVIRPAPTARFLPMPPWAEVTIVNGVDHSGPIQGDDREFDPEFGGLPTLVKANSGPSSGLQVNLATGIESYL